MKLHHRLALVAFVASVGALPACAAESDSEGEESDDAHVSESNLTATEKERICNAIPAPRPWTAEEKTKLASETVRRFVELKKTNDALIKSRGVGNYAGARTEIWKAISIRNDRAAAAALIKPKLKPGFDANRVAAEMQGTSCIGRVYDVLREVYKDLGRATEWAAIEKCGRAWDSDGLHVQQALIKNGWPSPTLGIVTDEAKPPGNAEEISLQRSFQRAITLGSYYGTPVSKTTVLKNFMPTLGSPTRRDDSVLDAVGQSKFLAVGTFRGAFHVPFIIPASAVPEDVAPAAGAERTAWLDARRRNEPFIMESHSLRQPWDPTNFEIKPMKEVIAITMNESVVYSTGTILFAPGSTYVVR